eukprot:NODE_1232_length_1203_cov_203.541812.p2 GENE.NODE_1232_length_1203_cov_203.541812~~NODE_1232_length_1203_cov_203.541812.p2  ORF type:complete len:278 (+),score=86.10 NODE_1232_length_1203_cov_203.541812:321-1154(+)
MYAALLQAEHAKDVEVVDLTACGRRDVGTFGILGTGITTRHCRRLGEIMVRATEACRVPHVEAFCYGTREDEWVVAHCGGIKIHLFTIEAREDYRLDLLWQQPEEWFMHEDFPHYVQIYGLASQAHLTGGHVTLSSGSRSTTTPIAAPSAFRDELFSTLDQPDYAAAEDQRFTDAQAVAVGSGPEASQPEGEDQDDSLDWLLEDDAEVAAAPERKWRDIDPELAELDGEEDTDDEDEDEWSQHWPAAKSGGTASGKWQGGTVPSKPPSGGARGTGRP